MNIFGVVMFMKRFFYAAFLIFILCSCSKNVSSMKDGYYIAEMAEFNERGWKDYLTIRVSGGKIIHVEYDANNPSGFIKSWDMEYMRAMKEHVGIYPNAYTRIYSEGLLKNQSTAGIDCISGATYSFHVFIQLAEAVLENAKIGKTGIELVHGAGTEGHSLRGNN